ncbi:PLP-dependent aminotransferase family protein [Kineococcus gynurae]|uniref:PLP-dependent aminotransferase family protein n=1 Tax=Kineococcus gynurae TaxID=452979 RepID=A0ABV5LS41_9ACTN
MQTVSARALGSMLDSWRAAVDPSRPAYSVLADRIALLAQDGRVPVGARLPAERDLAAALGVSRTTISATYGVLRERAVIDSVRGSGSVVLPRGAVPTLGPGAPGDLLDLRNATRPGTPEVATVAAAAVEDLPALLGGNGYEPQGLPALRAAVAERYTRRGLPTDPDQVLVTSGAQHAIGLLTHALVAPGDRVLVESPGYPHAGEALRRAGGRPLGLPVSVDGWDADALEDAFDRARPRAAYLVPDFQNPTAAVMPGTQRRRVADLARRYGTRLLIDETMSDLAHHPTAPPAPFGVVDPRGDVVHIGSLSKSVWAGVRIGWIRADVATVRQLLGARPVVDLGTSVLDQLIATRLLPRLDEIVETRRPALRESCDAFVTAVRELLPEWSVPRVAGGLMTWIGLGAPVSSALVVSARTRGLLLSPGPRFGLDGAFEAHLRVPHTLPPEQMRAVARVLADSWADLGRLPRQPRVVEPALV